MGGEQHNNQKDNYLGRGKKKDEKIKKYEKVS